VWEFIKQAYADSARIIVALPLLFALPTAAELIQHFIEYRLGMYDSVAAMQAAGDDPARMGFGQVKILTLILLLYWVSRWQAFRGSNAGSVLGDRRSALLFLGVVLFAVAIGLVQQFGGTFLAPLIGNENRLLAIGFAFFILSLALDIYLSGWKVGSALGNPRLTIPASFRLMQGSFWWSLAYYVLMTLPLMTVHYALAVVGLGQSDLVLWTVLTVDALIVGYLGLVLSTTTYLISQRAAARAGVPLTVAPNPA
jgi:hypothetical protein